MKSKCHFHLYTPRDNDSPLKAGYFAHEKAKGDYEIYELDDWDENWLGAIYIPEEEAIFRCSTETTRRVDPGARFLVKINFERLFVYFNDPEAAQSGKVMFDTRGIQIEHLFVTKTFYDKIQLWDTKKMKST